jgi:cytochrome oxidase Cu insertion factor (SCO1/SenC/PrrC family)
MIGRSASRVRLILAACLVVAAPACAGSTDPTNGQVDVQYGTEAAPFALVDQFGQPEHLSDFAGTVVLLTFVDPRCSGICPLTADLLRRTKDAVAGEPPVELVAIDANPEATAIRDVRRWSARHGMLHDWLFLTGPVARLKRIWARYGVTVLEQDGDVGHSSAVFLIDGQGRERGIFPIAAQKGLPDEVSALVRAVREIV